MSILLYQTIANDIEQAIITDTYHPGDKLPSERILAEQYKVSRNVIREAIKVLVQKKLIQNVIGKGNYVTLPQQSDLIQMVESALNVSDISINEIVDAREELELSIGKHIFRNFDSLDLTALFDTYQKMENCINSPIEFIKLDNLFHQQLADLSGNQPLKVFYMTLNNLISKSFFYGDSNSLDGRLSAQQEHKQIIDSIQTHNMNGYQTAIHLHLKLIRDLITRHGNES